MLCASFGLCQSDSDLFGIRHITNSKALSSHRSCRPAFDLFFVIFLFLVFLKKFGIEVKFVPSDDPKDFAKAIDEKTKAIYVESIGNPKYNVAPISEIAKVWRNITPQIEHE